MHDSGHILHEYSGGRVFIVDALVACVCNLARSVDQYSVVGSHAGVNGTDVGRDVANLGQTALVGEGGGRFLFGSKDDAIRGCEFIWLARRPSAALLK